MNSLCFWIFSLCLWTTYLILLDLNFLISNVKKYLHHKIGDNWYQAHEVFNTVHINIFYDRIIKLLVFMIILCHCLNLIISKVILFSYYQNSGHKCSYPEKSSLSHVKDSNVFRTPLCSVIVESRSHIGWDPKSTILTHIITTDLLSAIDRLAAPFPVLLKD